jgi:hypothetical protein
MTGCCYGCAPATGTTRRHHLCTTYNTLEKQQAQRDLVSYVLI